MPETVQLLLTLSFAPLWMQHVLCLDDPGFVNSQWEELKPGVLIRHNNIVGFQRGHNEAVLAVLQPLDLRLVLRENLGPPRILERVCD